MTAEVLTEPAVDLDWIKGRAEVLRWRVFAQMVREWEERNPYRSIEDQTAMHNAIRKELGL